MTLPSRRRHHWPGRARRRPRARPGMTGTWPRTGGRIAAAPPAAGGCRVGPCDRAAVRRAGAGRRWAGSGPQPGAAGRRLRRAVRRLCPYGCEIPAWCPGGWRGGPGGGCAWQGCVASGGGPGAPDPCCGCGPAGGPAGSGGKCQEPGGGTEAGDPASWSSGDRSPAGRPPCSAVAGVMRSTTPSRRPRHHILADCRAASGDACPARSHASSKVGDFCGQLRPVCGRNEDRPVTDHLDAQLVELLRDEPRVGVLEATRRGGRGPRHGSGAAGPDAGTRGDHRVRPRCRPGRPRLRRYRLRDAADSARPAARSGGGRAGRDSARCWRYTRSPAPATCRAGWSRGRTRIDSG